MGQEYSVIGIPVHTLTESSSHTQVTTMLEVSSPLRLVHITVTPPLYFRPIIYSPRAAELIVRGDCLIAFWRSTKVRV